MNGGYTEARFDTTDLRDALPDDEATAGRQRDRGLDQAGGEIYFSSFAPNTAIKFFNAIKFFLCSSTGTQLQIPSLQIISSD